MNKNDIVVFKNCEEAIFYSDCHFICETKSFKTNSNKEVVFLKGFSGYVETKFLESVYVD